VKKYSLKGFELPNFSVNEYSLNLWQECSISFLYRFYRISEEYPCAVWTFQY